MSPLRLAIWKHSFQPTLPVRGATQGIYHDITVNIISTHAPRAGSDQVCAFPASTAVSFQPTLARAGSDYHSPY